VLPPVDRLPTVLPEPDEPDVDPLEPDLTVEPFCRVPDVEPPVVPEEPLCREPLVDDVPDWRLPVPVGCCDEELLPPELVDDWVNAPVVATASSRVTVMTVVFIR